MAPTINFKQVSRLLNEFKFNSLFVEHLGWSNPPSNTPSYIQHEDKSYTQQPIAELGGVMVYEIISNDQNIPTTKERKDIHKEISKQQLENILIFIDQNRNKSFWYWVKREDGKSYPREHTYFTGQPADLFFTKLSGIVFSFEDFDDTGSVSVAKVTSRLKEALDVEKVTKRFYKDFQDVHVDFLDYLNDITDERKRRWYASVLLNRLMFIYFLQKKRFVNKGDLNYLKTKYDEISPTNNYYQDFLNPLFFEGFAKPEEARTKYANETLGEIPYLNGGLFLPHQIEIELGDTISIDNQAFNNILKLFENYSWNLDDTPGGNPNEINPNVLGYIFEKYINQKELGAYYTRPEITDYLCEQTIDRLILDKINTNFPDLPNYRNFESVPELLSKLDSALCKKLLFDVLPSLTLLDPACGSGAFLVAALKKLISVYTSVVGWIKLQGQSSYELKEWLEDIEKQHEISYYIKKQIITNNLYGVDIVDEAVEIAKVRLFLALVASAQNKDQLEPLPNIDFNILPGNSLIGLMHVDPEKFDKKEEDGTQTALFGHQSYQQLVEKKNRLIDNYRTATGYSKELQTMRDEIAELRKEANEILNQLLLDEFEALGIKYTEVTWDLKDNKEGKKKKRKLTKEDMEALQPFHWGYEFSRIVQPPELGGKGGFDAIIANPPWDIFKPNAKEIYLEYSDNQDVKPRLKKMPAKEFQPLFQVFLRDKSILEIWESYLSSFPHVSEYFRASKQYENQISYVNGKKVGSDTNLYKLFTELTFRLLKDSGQCGIIIPTGIYTDLGAKRLRELLFSKTDITSLFGLSNERYLFENIDHRVKITLLTFQKSEASDSFRAAFRINPREAITPDGLEDFLHNPDEHVKISIPLISKLSPDSLSVMEFRSKTEVDIARKMLKHPLLSEKVESSWPFVLTSEFHMTNHSRLFAEQHGEGALPLYEGKMIWHFNHQAGEPRYWIEENIGRESVIGRGGNTEESLDYQDYRLGIRAVASSTNARTLVATVLPKNIFCGNSILTTTGKQIGYGELLYLASILSSMILDAFIRNKVSTNINMFFIYQLPVPHLSQTNPRLVSIANRAAKLICTTPEYDDLAAEVGLDSHNNGVTNESERIKLRAELDAIIAHLYGITEEEFAHVLSTFPLTPDPVKVATQNAYRDIKLGLMDDIKMSMFQDPTEEDKELAELIAQGENRTLEFKEAAIWNAFRSQRDGEMFRNIYYAVASFMNSDGGVLLIGVNDAGEVVGLQDDFREANAKKPSRDGYRLFLSQKLDDLSKDNTKYYDISFHTVNGKEICKVDVRPAPVPVYVGDALYIRATGGKKKLNPKETVAYIQNHWGAS